MMAPLAIVEAVVEVASVRADIKWPNDVQVAGNKLAGVLIELVGHDGVVSLVGAGINVNLNPAKYEEIKDIATSVAAETGREWEREVLLAAYLLHFERIYRAALRGESPRDAWRARLVTLGHPVHARWPGGEADGIAEDVDDEGSLIIRTSNRNTVTVEAGDVTLRS